MDRGWRHRWLTLGPACGLTVLDVACGTGDLCRELAAAATGLLG